MSLVEQIARRHGLGGEPEPMPQVGLTNEAWRLGDHVVRICLDAKNDDEVAREQWLVPRVVAAGLRTPALVAADLSCALAPRPYTVYRLATGALLGACDPHPRFEAAHRELGRQAARLHAVPVAEPDRPRLRDGAAPDPQPQLELALAGGLISIAEARPLRAWLDALAVRGGAPGRAVLLHRDLHPWNLLVDPASGALTAILDWGDAAFGDPATELISMPLFALPAMLDGYRDAGGAIDDGLIARVLWGGTMVALWELRAIEPDRFDRRWWRMPEGGWAAAAELIARLFPDLAP